VSLSPVVFAAATVALMQFGRAFVRLRRRGRTDHAGWGRAVLFAAGIALTVVPLVSPLAGGSLAGHMLEHVLIADVAVALLLLAVRGPLLFFVVPATAARAFARRTALRRAAAWLTRPGPALAVWACVYAAWHVPAAYDYAVAHESVHAAEHLSFVVAGFLVWTLLVDPAGRRTLWLGARLAVAGALFAFGQVLSDLLLLAPEPLFPSYAGEPSALRDQQLAGVVMMAEQLLTLGLCALLLVRASLRASAARRLAAV
jgi:putative copper resistance protein D